MRAGTLKHVIVIERSVSTVNDAGTPIDTWSPLATVRAELAELATTEETKKPGSIFPESGVFKIRHRQDIAMSDRLAFRGDYYSIVEIKDFGRRGGLELRCTLEGSSP